MSLPINQPVQFPRFAGVVRVKTRPSERTSRMLTPQIPKQFQTDGVGAISKTWAMYAVPIFDVLVAKLREKGGENFLVGYTKVGSDTVYIVSGNDFQEYSAAEGEGDSYKIDSLRKKASSLDLSDIKKIDSITDTHVKRIFDALV